MAETPDPSESRIGINTTGVGYDLVPSDPNLKSRGWEKLFGDLPEFVASKKQGSGPLLLRIHAIMTPGVRELPPVVLGEMELGLYSLDRPDGDIIHQKFYDGKYDQVRKQAVKDNVTIPEYMRRMKLAFKELALGNHPTTINLNPQISGKLRSYGIRQVEGFSQEEVCASHINVMMGTDLEFVYALGGANLWPPPAYYGLSIGLPEVYQELCEKYDSMFDLKGQDALLREALFQLIGTRVLHPFWDGNGRAFGGFLAVSLQDQGINVSSDQLKDGIERLSSINDQMLSDLLHNTNLSLVKDDLHLGLFISPLMRKDYMIRLRAGIDHAIQAGIDPKGEYFPLIQRAARIIERVGSK